ncbi:hypothetical protein EBQ93_04690 [bacterium]|nr:hypothetical protein [bacterium]
MKKLFMVMGLFSVGSVLAVHRSFRLTNVGLSQILFTFNYTIKGKDQTKSILVNPASSKNANSNTFPIDADFTKITLICSLQPGQSRRDLQIKEISQHDLNAINHKQWSGHRWQITGSALVDGTALTYQLYKDGNSNLNA